MKDYGLEVSMKVEIIDFYGLETQTWDYIDDRYGRIVAYQVAEEWPLASRNTNIDNMDSISELYLDPRVDTFDPEFNSRQAILFTPCGNTDKGNELRKCLDTTNSYVSGGTTSGQTEHMVIIGWQTCDKYNASYDCAGNFELLSFLNNVKITLEVAENYIDFSEEETDDAIKRKSSKVFTVDSASINRNNIKG